MRGKVYAYFVYVYKYRITPAYAGKSTVIPKIEDGIEDHPRLCGEKFPNSAKKFTDSRITPAYAGKSISVPGGNGELEDHPRLCGEKSFSVELVSSGMGSPPPMRGKAII